jgi:hypothetical protein
VKNEIAITPLYRICYSLINALAGERMGPSLAEQAGQGEGSPAWRGDDKIHCNVAVSGHRD